MNQDLDFASKSNPHFWVFILSTGLILEELVTILTTFPLYLCLSISLITRFTLSGI